MRKILKEFKEFATRGNVIDLAVGVVIGAAFSAIVTAFVDHILMPVVGIITGGFDISGLSVTVGTAVFAYGQFINAVINFLLIAIFLFTFVKIINRTRQMGKKKEEEVKPEPVRVCEFCRQPVDKLAVRCPHCTSEIGPYTPDGE